MDDVILAIEADSYDSLSPEGQTKVNKQIYQQIRKYIPNDYVYFMDQDIEVSDAEYVESMTDQAILLALIHASSEEVFKEIHDALGPNEYRVGALTDDIYNANPNRGFILVDKSGDMGWYPACNFIQEAKNGKGKALILVWARSRTLREKANSLEGYINFFDEENSVSQQLQALRENFKN
jgi:hypothetical protein